MDIMEFYLLLKKSPGIFETYPHYKQRMFMIAINGLDEEEFNDLKRIFIKQCETYDAYTTRMNELKIFPMTEQYAFKLKITVPREFEKQDGAYRQILMGSYQKMKRLDIRDPIRYLDEFSFFIENPEIAEPAVDIADNRRGPGDYREPFTRKRSVIAFNEIRQTIFKFILPCAFENYENYNKRIHEFREKYDFRDFEDINLNEREIFRTFIQPLTKEEFTDLKLRFPKLSETPLDYEDRFATYDIQPLIINDQYNLFNTFKHSQIQPSDNFDSYAARYKKIASNKRAFLAKMRIPFHENFDSFKSFLESLEKNDYDDVMNVFPKYYDTFQEYNEIMKERSLQPVSIDYFKMFKDVHPHLLDDNFNVYEARVKNGNNLPFMNQHQFDQFKLRIPGQFESVTAYIKRVPGASTDDIERFKRIYPKMCSTLLEFSITMNDMGISMVKETFEFYKNQFPQRNETNYTIYSTRLNSLRFPKAPERYSNYKQRMQSISLDPLDKSEFNNLKKLFSIPYETYNEHVDRLNSYSIEPLSLETFKKEKSLRVLVGETFADHKTRIMDIFINPELGLNTYTDSNVTKLINDEGIESLIVENFMDHVLTYPFNYDSFEKFCWRQNRKDSIADPDPLVKTQIWYDRMKKLLPKLNENIEIYRNRTKEDNLEFPEITLKQFYRHLYELPHPAESFLTFDSRTQIKDSSDNHISISIPSSVNEAQNSQPPMNTAMSTPSPPKHTMSRRTQFNTILSKKNTCPTNSQTSQSLQKFDLCPEIHKHLNVFKKEYLIFLDINEVLEEDDFNAIKIEKFELRNIQDNILEEFLFLGYTSSPKELYKLFQDHFPRAFDSDIDLEQFKNSSSIFNHDELDSIKTCLGVMDTKSFISFKANFPKLFESWEDFNERRLKLMYPEFFENINSYNKRLSESKLVFPFPYESYPQYKIRNAVLPQIDESYGNYKTRFVQKYFHAMNYKTSEATDTNTPGAMTYDEFVLFKNSLPMPEELREDYTNLKFCNQLRKTTAEMLECLSIAYGGKVLKKTAACK
ncbi:uncharacterized protein LOC112602179 [Melanaphis sacchari]|uniref:uncharacterized protein LOC112602179 n=1 Tax=Melanaphis sacchari TaxID=742174 RepID=UPI000DC153CA|nr:uncharacterized protein LOC112602179 [Melanaphis sacchari]